MNIREKIDEIIARRKGTGQWEGKGRVASVEQMIVFYQNLLSELESYSVRRDSILLEINNQQGDFYLLTASIPGFADALHKASPKKACDAVRAQLKELESLKNRFNRDTINISVIGRAGQGKSRLLQSISGVGNAVIPADKGGDCTGAKSVICNEKCETYAVVRFFTDTELISNIQKYLDELGANNKLGNVSQIKSLPLSELEKLVGGSNKKDSYYQKLCSYVEHYDDYIKYLGGETTVKEGDIRGFVAQYLEGEPRIYVYKYLAVKEVEIHTPFVFGEAGKIMLVDTIGLGDTSIGLRDKMIETLINDSDAAILLRRPDAERDDIREEDNELYDNINDKMKGRDLSLWLFYILNTYGENRKTSDKLYESLNRKLGKTLQAAFVKQLDCADKDKVQSELIEPLLASLSNNLNTIDDSLIKIANEKGYGVFNEVITLNDTLSSTLSESVKSSPESYRLFSSLYKNLTLRADLRRLNIEYIDRHKKNAQLDDAIRGVLKNIKNHIPSESDIIGRLESGDASSRLDTVYNRLCDNLRSNIRNDFDEVCGKTIVQIQEDVKKQIIAVLQNKGLLSNIPLRSSELRCETEWLQALISERMESFDTLQMAFSEILNYNLHIEGLLRYKVHCALDILEEHSPEEAPEGKRIGLNEEETQKLPIPQKASVIHQTLVDMVSVFVEDLYKSVSELLEIPNNSFNALIRKLREVLGYEEESEDDLKAFYNKYAHVIWKEEFDKANAYNDNVKQLKDFTSCFEGLLNKQDYIIK